MNSLLAPLASGYGWAAGVRTFTYRRGWLKQLRLNRPVISIGNLSTGGTGKTPLVAHVTRLLVRRGLKPAILTRGYGRRDENSLIAIEPAESRSPEPREIGDEPALLAAALPCVPVVVCANRYRAGRFAEEHFSVDVHLLDDGFQHLRLARDLDIVAVDVTQELSDRQVLPAGRLRERCSALRRADLIVLTRTDLADPAQTIERLEQIHTKASIFHSKTKLTGFTEIATGRSLAPDAFSGSRVFAFCGVGNPCAFFLDLRRWKLDPVAQRTFPDHHVYTEDELTSLLLSARNANASILVTTEKDAVNFPCARKGELNVFACVIEAEIAEADTFEQTVIETL